MMLRAEAMVAAALTRTMDISMAYSMWLKAPWGLNTMRL